MARPKVLALILAGGAGSRLEVLTKERAKPAVPFAGTYRLVDFALSNCLHSEISNVWIVEQYQPHALNEHLANGRPWDLDRTYGGLQVLPPYLGREEGGFSGGNADALYRQRAFIRDFDPDVLLVLSADHVYTLDYRDPIERHLASGADVTLVTAQVPREAAGRFGVVEVGGDGQVTGFEYKPEEPRSDVVTTEVFVYRPGPLLEMLDRLSEEAGEGEDSPLKDFGHALLPRFVEEGRAAAFPLDGFWRDVGTIPSYWDAHRELLSPEPPLRLDDPAWPILTYGTQRQPARIQAGARVEDSLLSPGCTVGGEVVRSVIGPGVRIAPGAVVRDAILFHDVIVEAGARVEGAILDEQVAVGRDARVGGRANGQELALLGRRVQVPKGRHVAPGAMIAPGGSVDDPEGPGGTRRP